MAQAPKKVATPSAAPAPVTQAAAAPETATATVSTKAAPATGVEQVEIAKNATKSGNKVILGNGEERVAYIRRRIAEGASRGTVAKELGVPYQIVFAATKAKKEPAVQAPAESDAAA